jgi:6-phosphogluconolactonase
MSDIAGRLTIYASPELLADGVAAWLTDLATAKDDVFAVCLSGGSTPKRLYETLAQTPYREQFPWRDVHWFFGDERFVPATHKDNNYRMVAEALFSKVPIPPENIHRIVTERAEANDAAADYDKELRSFYGSSTLDPDRPLFDVNFLGLGPDGHTASLIPGEPVLEERQKWVGTVAHGRPEVRITLTYPVLESSRDIAFLVTGKEKAAILKAVRSGESTVPAARLRTAGQIHWFVDRDAEGV